MDNLNAELQKQAALAEQAAKELKANVMRELKEKVKLDLNKKQKKKKLAKIHAHPNCMIFVEKTHTRIFRYVAKKFIPSGAAIRDYLDMPLYFLGLDLKGEFWFLDVPRKIEEGETPTDLYMAKHCALEVEEVYGLSMGTMEKIKLGILVGLCIAVLIVIFLIVSSAGGA